MVTFPPWATTIRSYLPLILGGAAVYAAFLPKAHHVLRTTVDLEVIGDTRAPELDSGWEVSESSGWLTSDTGLNYLIEELRPVNGEKWDTAR